MQVLGYLLLQAEIRSRRRCARFALLRHEHNFRGIYPRGVIDCETCWEREDDGLHAPPFFHLPWLGRYTVVSPIGNHLGGPPIMHSIHGCRSALSVPCCHCAAA